VDVIATFFTGAALAAKAATSSIPIVFSAVTDPVRAGLVVSFNRPGGNVTGMAQFAADLLPKRLELLHEFVPTSKAVGALVRANIVSSQAQTRDAEEAGRALGLDVHVVKFDSNREIEEAFSTLVQRGVGALLIGSDSLFAIPRVQGQLVVLSARHGIPAMFPYRENVVAGGLISYGTSLTETCRQAGVYVGRVLKGEKPADLPVVQPTKFELVINLKTAKAFGLKVPNTLLVAADEVIE
jgi:putative ABC transport system substrate-binding protein